MASIETLPDEVIQHILQFLVDNPNDLISVCFTSKRLNSVCMHQTWQPVCHAKWQRPFAQAHPGNFHRLFASSNGLLGTDVHLDLMELPDSCGYLKMAMHTDLGANMLHVAVDGTHQIDICTISTTSPVADNELTSGTPIDNSRTQPQGVTTPPGTINKGFEPRTIQHVPLPIQMTTALGWCQGGQQLLVGSMSGHIHVIQRKEQHHTACTSFKADSRPPCEAETHTPHYDYQLQYTIQPFSNLPVSQIACLEPHAWVNTVANNNNEPAQHAGTGWPVAVLHDKYWCDNPTPSEHRNPVNIYNPETGQYIRSTTIQDMFTPWDFICMQPISPYEMVLGSVADACTTCACAEYAWCCPHRLQTRNSMLWMMDLRVSDPLVSRYSLLQTTLYPHLATMRQHYVATSHAHKALNIWDLRQMSMPVYEVNRVDNLPSSQWGPLGPPEEAYYGTWELHLSCCDDMLVGQSETGTIWLWDLADCLGWAKDNAYAEDVDDIERRMTAGSREWPYQLGCAPSKVIPQRVQAVPGAGAPRMVCLTDACAWDSVRLKEKHPKNTTVEVSLAGVSSTTDMAIGSGVNKETAVSHKDMDISDDVGVKRPKINTGRPDDPTGNDDEDDRITSDSDLDDYDLKEGNHYCGHPVGDSVHSLALHLNALGRPHRLYRRRWVIGEHVDCTGWKTPKPVTDNEDRRLYRWRNVEATLNASTDVHAEGELKFTAHHQTMACISLYD